jgi:polyisoprenoid-binding protein YceI
VVGQRTKLIGGSGAVGLVVVALAIFFLFFRDSAPVSVDSVEAAEARQEAIAAAVAGSGDATADAAQPTAAVESADDAYADDEGETELDSGQPDSNASVGAATDGVWSIDTSIGTFDATCLTDVCGSSFAGFRINEELANFGAKTVVGRTPGVSGSLELVDTQVIGAEFVVDMTGLITDNNSRTGALRGPNGGIETAVFPEARFELTQPIELGSVPAEGASIQVQAVGNLTVHGVTNAVTIPLTAELQAGVIIVFGNLEGMLLSDYDIAKPTAAVVVSVEDNATLELQLFFRR